MGQSRPWVVKVSGEVTPHGAPVFVSPYPSKLVKRLAGGSRKESRYWSQPSAYWSETRSKPVANEAFAVSSAADSEAAKLNASVRCRLPQSPVRGNRPVCTTVPFGAEA